ncbi:aspartate/glutamate racemase family protein [Halomonas sp. CUBES01]|uniref:Aspartate/glutamate racemase family protein n=1 Tax=Vreelandella gomseomensis TaxID=370766 RepID=A0ABU1GBD6_9GAMM|nr:MULTISPECIES: aspartate/glutamate racemase family protein [Halomonas]MDR5874602.1 aspartate/glutamate racemase family protein [Halomonas gomseomensis]MEC4767587.1 aspartate/glutamate racemase family protein [Halomonas sp. CUBES01]
MKTTGLLGGMSWESTQTYYRMLNQGVAEQLGGFHSAKIVLYSVDFAEIETLQRQGDWEAMADILANAACSLAAAGADFLVIGTNTMHKVAAEVEAASGLPLLHIAEATADILAQQGIDRVGLLGTQFTMEQPFYRQRLEARGIEVIVPEPEQREVIHRVIYQELCRGTINPASKEAYLDVVATLSARGAQGVILGCTEIGLLINQSDTPVALFDTTEIHAQRAVAWALGDGVAF